LKRYLHYIGSWQSGGVALFVPDHTYETFKPSSSLGGKDGDKRGLRYPEWTFDPDPTDSTCVSFMAYMLREGEENVTCALDHHLLGLFSHGDWLRLIAQVGFEARSLIVERNDDAPDTTPIFIGIKPEEG
jgi:hypothetical protein